jgi:hypothetical protein
MTMNSQQVICEWGLIVSWLWFVVWLLCITCWIMTNQCLMHPGYLFCGTLYYTTATHDVTLWSFTMPTI